MFAASSVQAGSTNPEYNRQIINAGGQATALGVMCGKVNAAQAAAQRARLRRKFIADGVKPALFDSTYDGAYTSVLSKAKAHPDKARQACAQLRQMGAQSGK